MEKPRILIIDDDPNLRKTLSDILGAKGYETFSAENGTEGLVLLKDIHINLVFIDLMLPDMPGIEVLERLKAECRPTEAIILTGNASLNSAIEATNRGAFSYLVKPYEMDQLLLLARRAIEKQQVEEALREREERFRKIFVEGPLGMAIADLDRRFLKVNDMMCKILGYSEEELTSISIVEITHPEDKDPSFRNSMKLLKGDVPFYKMVKRYIRKDGEVIWAKLTVSIIRDDAGNPLYFLEMMEDITSQKLAEEEREHLILDLKDALARIKTLTGMLPICASCKKIRDDKGYWNQLEQYISEHSDVLFSHCLCPDCAKKEFKKVEDAIRMKFE
jgi:PAS domain S-box-containing protein